ncbi:TPR-like protein [Pseudovirgaria hyperparasitica]|uniref:TPR-like protein n=1 Tax=Pseudovirgaria hyperparasitica TaxID=470096 RepID=A0A6A6WFB5_9PEZI|nr:TPR-like protein [Pseudovirgaria hyperparasitica]KAF2760849.1 TPR-like protein [Pseudovirgaria hyperparasitica]
MSSSKAALKAAKAAIDAGKWGDAVEQALRVLSNDPENYFAKLFLGRAYDKLGRTDDASSAYESAAALRPNEKDPYLGLRELYGSQGGKKVDQYIDLSVKIAGIYAVAEDKHRCQEAVDKLVGFAKANGTKLQYSKALRVLLPNSSLYDFLEGRISHPAITYKRLVELTETEEKEKINKEIGERRTRLGARIGQVTNEVRREVFERSDLEELYQQVIDWTNEDDVRREYEEKLLQRIYDVLVVTPSDKKEERRKQVIKMAEGMVIIKHSFLLAWQIELEWKDVEEIAEMDVNVLREFVEFFPENGLAKVLKAYLASDRSPFPEDDSDEGGAALENSDDEQDGPLTSEDVLLLMTDGIDAAKDSYLAHRLISEYYLYTEEYESSVETSRKALKLLKSECQKSGLKLQNDLDSLNSVLGTSLVQYQTPRHHPEAKSIFSDILSRKPQFTPALIGVGLVLEEEEEYAEAIGFLRKAFERDDSNIRIGTEAAWCKALNGDYATGRAELEQLLEQIDLKDSRTRDLRSQTCYRIGVCQWELDSSKAARKDRKRAYAMFLAAIKANPNFAPAYTSLGNYYADYAKDKKRARSCFQKAFELSASEIVAAERLARSFADQGEWDIVEIIAQRVVDSGKAKPPPGSRKKKGISWPFSALGVVQMNKQEYSKSVVSFLAALRISPDDYHSYVGLGESYHNSGRYNSAARTFKYAENPAEGVMMKKTGEAWFTKYMLANVNRELGEYEAATAGYEEVLRERKQEFGVAIALLQTLVDQAWKSLATGFFGQAAQSAIRAIETATEIADYKPEAFNLWKAVGDACAVFSAVQSKLDHIPFDKIRVLLEKNINIEEFDIFVETNKVGADQVKEIVSSDEEGATSKLRLVLHASILAQKRAIYSCANDIHARAVSWYNLGWTEHRAHVHIEQNPDGSVQGEKVTKHLKAAMKCFKRAIELEAGNSEFWNALGVVSTQLNPKVAQHCFVRSLHLNERSVVVWTNLGTLYLLRNDLELAHQAFSRAQSTDPDYAHAWVGEGLIALLWGDAREALSHFTHAFEISDSALLITKQQYTLSTFDHLLSSAADSSNITNLIQPLFALQQLISQTPTDTPFRHLYAIYFERIGDYSAAVETLKTLCSDLEAEYETTESLTSLSCFAAAKADLARNLLATHAYATAAENADTALDLTSDSDSLTIDVSTITRIRLSCRLVLGLAYHYLARTTFDQLSASQAIAAFRTALEESASSAEVVCLLATILWADGGANEKDVARDQLFDVISSSDAQNVDAIILLGAMAAIENDTEALEAVYEDLANIRSGSVSIDTLQARRVEIVLDAIASLSSKSATDNDPSPVLASIQKSILLSPGQPHGWAQLAGETDAVFPAEMALVSARRAVPPMGPLDAADLAKAYSGTGTAADAQRATALAPWMRWPSERKS